MSAKHTPGPWRYERSRNGTAIVFGGPGCTFPVVESRCEATEFYTEERHANARLIAAAPDGLEFARAFDEACTIKAGQSTKAVLGITELNRLWDMARAFLAKAEGREP